jgi:hypothetical protein
MLSIVVGLTLATCVSAQSVIGMTTVAASQAMTSAMSMPMASAAASSSQGYSNPAPQQSQYSNQYNNNGGYGGSSPSSSAAPMYTQPPQYSPEQMTSAMPYSSFMNGGYSSMNCGYGYQKGSDNKCSQMSWVCPF